MALPASLRDVWVVTLVLLVQFEARKEQLAQYETLDCGKPIVEAEADIVSCLLVRSFSTHQRRL